MTDHPAAPEQRTIDVDVRDVATEGRTLRGYAAVYGAESADLGGFTERIAPGAFADVLREEPDVRALLNHDPSSVLGRTRSGTLRLADDERGLRFELDLPESPLGENVRQAVKRGDIDGASFRFIVGRESWEGNRRTVETVKTLQDVTVATFGAYPAASVELRTRAARPTPDDSAQAREGDTAMSSTPTPAPSGDSTTTAGLAVEQRTSEATPTIESRIRVAMGGVRKGEVRSLTEASNAGPITPPEMSTYLWDRIRPVSVALASGMQTITTDRSEIHWPTLTGDVVPGFYEELEEITASDPTFSTLTAVPRKIAARTEVSNEVLDDSEPDALDVLTSHISGVIAAKLDHTVYEGSGSAPEFAGLKNTAGIQTVSMGTNGSTPTNLDFMADAIAALEAESIPGPYVAVMSPRTWATLRKLREATGSEKPLLGDPPTLDAPRSVYGVGVWTTAHLSTGETQGTANNTSSVYVYSTASNVGPAIVRRQDATVELDRSRLFNVDGSEVRGKVRATLVVPYPKAVVRVVGVKP